MSRQRGSSGIWKWAERMRVRWTPRKPSKYEPHQGKREAARRRRQLGLDEPRIEVVPAHILDDLLTYQAEQGLFI